MNQPGISIGSACAKKAKDGSGYLTNEDFEKYCNSDGTVKADQINFSGQPVETPKSDNSAFLYAGVAVAIIAVAVIAWFMVRRLKLKKQITLPPTA